MTFWSELRNIIKEKTTSSDITMTVYKKIATSGVNMLSVVKPSFYIGQMSALTNDYMSYVEKFLASEDRDWGEYLKFILYIREISKRLLVNLQDLQGPLLELTGAIEEIFEGERYNPEDELEEEPEPESLEELENVNLEEILESSSEKLEEKEDEESMKKTEETRISREEMSSDYEAFKEELKVKIQQAEVPQRVVEELSREIADVYLECVQLSKELSRLSRFPDGDLSTLMSILVDIQYGLCHEMKRHLMEDIVVEERFSFEPGLLTWTAHFLAEFSERVNNELKIEETAGREQ